MTYRIVQQDSVVEIEPGQIVFPANFISSLYAEIYINGVQLENVHCSWEAMRSVDPEEQNYLDLKIYNIPTERQIEILKFIQTNAEQVEIELWVGSKNTRTLGQGGRSTGNNNRTLHNVFLGSIKTGHYNMEGPSLVLNLLCIEGMSFQKIRYQKAWGKNVPIKTILEHMGKHIAAEVDGKFSLAFDWALDAKTKAPLTIKGFAWHEFTKLCSQFFHFCYFEDNKIWVRPMFEEVALSHLNSGSSFENFTMYDDIRNDENWAVVFRKMRQRQWYGRIIKSNFIIGHPEIKTNEIRASKKSKKKVIQETITIKTPPAPYTLNEIYLCESRLFGVADLQAAVAGTGPITASRPFVLQKIMHKGSNFELGNEVTLEGVMLD